MQSSEPCSVRSSPRQLRVAYLIDRDECSHTLLDVIFRESFGRWGGRRTLIVPAKTETGIDPVYIEWLLLFDADIIYSYIDLAPDVIADIHETYCPLYLKKHQIYGDRKHDDHTLFPKLPLNGVTSLSILPMVRERRGILDTNTRKILDKDFGFDATQFFTDNFGFVSHTYRNDNFSNFPEIYTPLRLISQKNLDNPRHGKIGHSEYITQELDALREVATKRNVFSMAGLSDCYAPYLEVGDYYEDSRCFNLVIGNTINDRLLYWNYHQRFNDLSFGEIADLIISPDSIENEEFAKLILEMVRVKCWRNNSNPIIALRSASLSREQLDVCAEKLKTFANYLWINVQKISSDADYINVKPGRDKPNYRSSFSWSSPKIDVTDFYSGNRVVIPRAVPMHFKDVSIPPAFRQGVWMLDAIIERHMTHSRISNVPHIWMLPRRLRLDKLFKHDYQSRMENSELRTLRVNRNYIPSLPTKYDSENIVLSIPEDNAAFGGASTAQYEWEHFSDPQKETSFSRSRFYQYNISDKGRYLKGVLKHFDTLFNAENIILNKFWYEIFVSLGVSPKKPSEIATSRLKKYIKRFLTHNKDSFLEDDSQQARFAEFSLRTANNISKDRFFISWRELNEKWEKAHAAWLVKNPHLSQQDEDNDWYYNRHKQSLEDSTQYLCQKQILFQGQLWRCPECLNKNWVSIDNLKANLSCDICAYAIAAPISDDWKFFLNGFILQAMQQHGITATIWCLVQLNQKANSSFYYVPSIEFYEHDEAKEPKSPVAEADIMAVVDGELFICEVKSSGRDNDFSRFLKVIERLRPDVALIAIMDDDVNIPQKIRNSIGNKIPKGVKFEIMIFSSDDFDDTPGLPSGRNMLVRIM